MPNAPSAIEDRPTATSMTLRQIKALLPHRYPMLLLDRVLVLERGVRITALKAVTCNEPWYRELAADAGDEAYDYPAALLLESWIQAAGVLVVCERPDRGAVADQVPLFGSVTGARFHGTVLPGDVVEHHVRLVRELGDTVIVEGESVVGSGLVMEIGRAVMATRPVQALDSSATKTAHRAATDGNQADGNQEE